MWRTWTRDRSIACLCVIENFPHAESSSGNSSGKCVNIDPFLYSAFFSLSLWGGFFFIKNQLIWHACFSIISVAWLAWLLLWRTRVGCSACSWALTPPCLSLQLQQIASWTMRFVCVCVCVFVCKYFLFDFFYLSHSIIDFITRLWMKNFETCNTLSEALFLEVGWLEKEGNNSVCVCVHVCLLIYTFLICVQSETPPEETIDVIKARFQDCVPISRVSFGADTWRRKSSKINFVGFLPPFFFLPSSPLPTEKGSWWLHPQCYCKWKCNITEPLFLRSAIIFFCAHIFSLNPLRDRMHSFKWHYLATRPFKTSP